MFTDHFDGKTMEKSIFVPKILECSKWFYFKTILEFELLRIEKDRLNYLISKLDYQCFSYTLFIIYEAAFFLNKNIFFKEFLFMILCMQCVSAIRYWISNSLDRTVYIERCQSEFLI